MSSTDASVTLALLSERQDRLRDDHNNLKANIVSLEKVVDKQQSVVNGIIWVASILLIIMLLVAFGPLEAMRAAFGLLPTSR